MAWKLSNIWFLTYRRNISVESTSIRRGVPVGLALSVHLAVVINVLVTVTKELNKIYKEFICRCKNANKKQSTLCNKYENREQKIFICHLKLKAINY